MQGRRIALLWTEPPALGVLYSARVERFDPNTGEHLVRYDHGAGFEWVHLPLHLVVFLAEPQRGRRASTTAKEEDSQDECDEDLEEEDAEEDAAAAAGTGG